MTYNEKIDIEAWLKENPERTRKLEDYISRRYSEFSYPQSLANEVSDSVAGDYGVLENDNGYPEDLDSFTNEVLRDMIDDAVEAGYYMALENIDRYGVLL